MSRSTVVAALVGVLIGASACGHPSHPAPSTPTPSPTTATAAPVAPDPLVGALFLGASDLHTCAATVLHSKNGDLILTAAHCLADGYATTFVPGFTGTGGPAGTWTVNAVYLDPRWVANQDPLADYAIARVGANGPDSLEARVGPGLALGATPPAGSAVTVTAYPLGTGGSPIGCSGPTGMAPGGFPSLHCAGFAQGTSGASWRSGSTVVGVIGGLHGGGCDENISYSPPFDGGVTQLLARAEAGGPVDTAPEVFEDDCA